MAVCHPLCHAVLGAYIPWICLISIVRRHSRHCCPCPFLLRPAPPSIRQIPAALPRFRSRRGYPAAEFGRCSRSHAAGCRCCWWAFFACSSCTSEKVFCRSFLPCGGGMASWASFAVCCIPSTVFVSLTDKYSGQQKNAKVKPLKTRIFAKSALCSRNNKHHLSQRKPAKEPLL